MKDTCYRIFRIVRRILLCCIVVILMAFFYKHYDEIEYSADNEQEYIDRVCKIAGVPALSVAVWDNENEVFLNYHNGDTKIDENSLYELASTSKAFTGLAMLQLQKSGLISFDSSVEQYIPEFHPTYKGTETQITIGQLLNHTSGIPSMLLIGYQRNPFMPVDYQIAYRAFMMLNYYMNREASINILQLIMTYWHS